MLLGKVGIPLEGFRWYSIIETVVSENDSTNEVFCCFGSWDIHIYTEYVGCQTDHRPVPRMEHH